MTNKISPYDLLDGDNSRIKSNGKRKVVKVPKVKKKKPEPPKHMLIGFATREAFLNIDLYGYANVPAMRLEADMAEVIAKWLNDYVAWARRGK